MSNDKNKEDVTLAIMQDGTMSDEMANKIKERFNEAGITVAIVAGSDKVGYRTMERKDFGGNIVIVPGFDSKMAKNLVEIVARMEKPVEAIYDDKEPQHLIQRNNADLPFYHNRRRW